MNTSAIFISKADTAEHSNQRPKQKGEAPPRPYIRPKAALRGNSSGRGTASPLQLWLLFMKLRRLLEGIGAVDQLFLLE